MTLCSKCRKDLRPDGSCDTCEKYSPPVTFEPTVLSSKYKRSWNWTWPQIFIVVILLLGGVHLYRVNAVRPGGAANLPKFISTTGAVVDGPLVVQAESFLPLKMDFNARVTLKGWFATGSARSRIECLVLNKDAFELWKNGREYQAVAKTGYLPSGRIERVLEPDTYYLIFDNQRAGEPEKEFNAFFEIE